MRTKLGLMIYSRNTRAGIFSAGLSTISAALNSLAAVTLEDYVKPVYKKCWSKEFSLGTTTTIAKLLAFVYGIVSVALAFLAQYLGGVLQVILRFLFVSLYMCVLIPALSLQAGLTIFGVVGGPLLGLFTLGMLTETATEAGSVTGATLSLAFLFWIAFGQPRPAPVVLPVTDVGCPNATLSTFQPSLPQCVVDFSPKNLYFSD